ncbi:MAG TPA: biotin/lipoyl-containing protein, partial [Steroidobacteraceae bacterium]|nr:biotin/lipoyl-containing protein [Steroidobacteraceae bacterium]
MSTELLVPDIGNFSDVPVVDVLVKPGDVVELETPLVTLETDKASMDVPSTAAGRLTEVLLKRGDKVSKGAVIARLEPAGAAASGPATPAASAPAAPPAAAPAAEVAGDTVRMPAPADSG